jgi:hypothetical protein
VLGAGFAEAAAHRWPLAIVHADRHPNPDRLEPDPGGPAPAVGLACRTRMSCAIESWRARYPQVAVHRSTIGGGPPTAALEHAAAGARLLVLGQSSHPLRPLRLIDQLLARVSCPIAVVPPAAVGQGAPEPAAMVATSSEPAR